MHLLQDTLLTKKWTLYMNMSFLHIIRVWRSNTVRQITTFVPNICQALAAMCANVLIRVMDGLGTICEN